MEFPKIDQAAVIEKFLRDVDAEAEQLSHRYSPNEETTRWTHAVKNVLVTIGTVFEFESYRSGREAMSKEFLLDFVWWDKKNEVAMLACESEFLPSAISVGEDFEKLLNFKCPFNLMIFDSQDSFRSDSIISELNRLDSKYGYHLAGEVYWAIDISKKRLIWKSEIITDGANKAFKFEPYTLS